MNPKNHCCEQMTRSVNFQCDQHENLFDCPDYLIKYNEVFDEYGIVVHDGGSSSILINYCPWCCKKLPQSKRDFWFEELEALGLEPSLYEDNNVPEEFRSDKWYNS